MMGLKVLGNWDYTPTFGGNKRMVVTFKRLSGAEELATVRNIPEGTERGVAMLQASIVEIKNPLVLELPDGEQRKMTAEDIFNIAELKELFYELLLEYGNKSVYNEEAAKKQG